MLKKTKALLARRFRNSQRGQTVVLMAFGFIALIAFIGLVTDISILFIRYSTLRRAVDAAALAAAGQIREGTEYGTVALAARQYIALHNLKPHSVWVETCETDIAAWRKDNPEPKSLDLMPKTELCDWDNPKKLVRVKAQIDSETTFLKIIGIENFIITSSATSETAVLDVALVLDNSRSMGDKHTDSVDYDNNDVAEHPACNGNLGWGGCCNDPGNGLITLIGTDWKIYTDNNGNKKYDAGDALGVTNTTADGDYSDLVCDPFKQVKDAARNFIVGLDFARGDRVAVVTFNRAAKIQYPNDNWDKSSPTYAPPMMNNEETAVDTLNKYVGIHINENGFYNGCKAIAVADDNAYEAQQDQLPFDTKVKLAPWSYDVMANCTNTNPGDGIRRANEVLTNVETIRREAVWVAIVLADGAANAGWVRPEYEVTLAMDNGVPVSGGALGALGFCPWSTFCKYRDPATTAYPNLIADPTNPNEAPYLIDVDNDSLGVLDEYNSWNNTGVLNGILPTTETYPGNYPECLPSINAATYVQPDEPKTHFCSDMNPTTRHKCLEWKNGPGNGLPANLTDPSDMCWLAYDADDYARDMADWAGLVEVAPKVPGNFIAMFAIGFGEEISGNTYASYPVGAPLLRYIADAGDNGQIDNSSDRAWRGLPPGTGDPCEGIVDPTTWCGQYYYADNLESLNQVFEDIASRLFTRLSR